MRRRDILLQAAALPVVATLGRTARADEGTSFDGATVRAMARDLAQHPWAAPDATLPPELKDLDYQQYRSIRFELTTDGLHALPTPSSIWREILLKRAHGIDVKGTDRIRR